MRKCRYKGDQNKIKIIFWKVGPLQYRLTPLGECSRNPSVSVDQLVLLWEAEFSCNEFFLKTLSTHLPFSWWMIHTCTCPHCTWVFSNFFFLPKTAWSLCSTFLITWSYPKQLFFCFPEWKESSKGNILLMWNKWNEKQQKHQNWQVQKLFWAVEKNRYIVSNGEYFEGDKFKQIRINTQFF